MNLIDYLLIAVVVLLVGLDIWYLRRRKKRCNGCASCPYAGSCSRIQKVKKK